MKIFSLAKELHSSLSKVIHVTVTVNFTYNAWFFLSKNPTKWESSWEILFKFLIETGNIETKRLPIGNKIEWSSSKQNYLTREKKSSIDNRWTLSTSIWNSLLIFAEFSSISRWLFISVWNSWVNTFNSKNVLKSKLLKCHVQKISFSRVRGMRSKGGAPS